MAEDDKPKNQANFNGDVVNSNVVVGDNNIINIEALKTATTLFTIPAPVTDFTGREKELEKLKAEISHGALISGVSGSGGIGKTELARKLARDIADDFPDARMEINLLGISETPLSSEEAMRRLIEPFYPNQKLPDDPNQLKGLYQQTFASKTTLLLLDNAANASQVRPLIPPAPSVAIITSRQHFSLSEFGLKEPLRLEELSPEEARELLRSALEKLKETTDAKVDELANLCGRLPLALRVSASLLNDSPNWTADTLIARLKDERTRLERLKSDGDSDLDVEATLSLSYNLLDDNLKKYFRMVSVFTVPFPDISAQAVWGMKDDDDFEGVLVKLVNRSLLDFMPVENIKGGLYSLHDLPRLFGTKYLLENSEEAKEAITNHAEYFLGWAIYSNAEYERGNEHILIGLSNFRFIWPELLVIWERLLPNHRFWPRPQDADKWLCDFPSLCGQVLDLTLSPKSITIFIEAGLSAAQRIGNREAEGILLSNLGLMAKQLGDSHNAISFLEQALPIIQESGNRIGEGATLNTLGAAYISLGDFNKAIEFYKQALEISREIGNRSGEGIALGNLGAAMKNFGKFREAVKYFNLALDIAREIGDRRRESGWLGSLGLIYTLSGNPQKAIESHQEQITIAEEIGDQYGLSNGLGNLGLAYTNLGNFESAIKCYQQALDIDRMRGDLHGEGEDLGYLGTIYADLEDLPRALEYFQQALAISVEINDRQNESNWLGHIANINMRLGNLIKAIEYQEQSRVISVNIGDRRGEGISVGNLGLAYANNLDNPSKAIELIEQALLIAKEVSDRRHEGIWLGNLGSIYFNLGKFENALKYYHEQIGIAREIGDRSTEGYALVNQGLAYRALGNVDKSIVCAEQALLVLDELKLPYAKKAYELLDELKRQKFSRTEQAQNDLNALDSAPQKEAEEFIHDVILAAKNHTSEAAQYFDVVSKMVRDSSVPTEIQELGKVLQKILTGINNPDMSHLPEELAKLVRDELNK